MTIRRAVVADAEVLLDLHHACWVEAYAGLVDPDRIAAVFADREAMLERRRDRLADPSRPTWVAEVDGVPVGFATAGPPRQDDPPVDLELAAIYARAGVWGTGVGRDLLAAAIGERAAYLWVLAGNERAIGFYERHSFAPDGASEEHPEGLHVRMVRG